MNSRTYHTRRNLKLVAYGLGIVLSAVAGTLAWVGTQSLVTSVAGAGLPLLFIISTVVFGRETPVQ